MKMMSCCSRSKPRSTRPPRHWSFRKPTSVPGSSRGKKHFQLFWWREADEQRRCAGEENIFGKSARWMDYSGPVPSESDTQLFEGITYIDHPTNRNYPNHWHVRQDGWMGASVCMNESIEITKQQPLTLRFLLHVHSGKIDAARAEQVAKIFQSRKPLIVQRSTKPHYQYEILRKS